MSLKAVFNDFDLFVGTLFFGLWALLLVTTPIGLTLVGATLRVGLSVLLLGVTFYMLKAGHDLRRREEQELAKPIMEVDLERQARPEGGSRAA